MLKTCVLYRARTLFTHPHVKYHIPNTSSSTTFGRTFSRTIFRRLSTTPDPRSTELYKKYSTILNDQKYAFIPGSDMISLLQAFGCKTVPSPSSLSQTFNSLPVNPAMDYKFAAEASVLLDRDTGDITVLPVVPFVLYGDDMEHPDGLEGQERLYGSLPASWSEGPLLRSYANLCSTLLASFSSSLPTPTSTSELLPPDWDSNSRSLVVKQWPARTVRRARDDVGEPSPEGVHQDGCEIACITFVNRENVKEGTGINRVWTLDQPIGKAHPGDASGPNMLGSALLSDRFSTFLFLDRHVRHEALAFEAEEKGLDAKRDVIVTFARRPMKDGRDFGKGNQKRGFKTKAGGGEKRVAVIGAGPSCMALINAVSKLEAPSDFKIKVFDKQDTWGGMWNYDWRTGSDEKGAPVTGSMYQQLWSNSAKETNEFLDYTYEEHFGGKRTPSYLPRHLMREYIVGRAVKAMGVDGVDVEAKFGTEVENVEFQEEKGTFVVTSEEGGEINKEEFDNVVVSSGHFSVPSSPSIPGFSDFEGRIMHSTDFRNANEFRDRKVVVVGNGNSGEDIALQCHKYGSSEVYLTYRTERSAINWPSGIEEIPNLVKVNGRTCYFKEGLSIDEVDAIVLCTGYKHSFPFLPSDLRLSTDNNLYPQGLYKGVAWLDNLKLYYMGMQDIWIGLKVYDCQAFWIVDNMLGGVGGGNGREMQRDIECWVEKLEGVKREGLREKLTFQKEYLQDLLDDVGEDVAKHYNKDYRSLLDFHVEDYMMVTKHKKEDPRSYRDKVFRSRLGGELVASEPPVPWMKGDEKAYNIDVE